MTTDNSKPIMNLVIELMADIVRVCFAIGEKAENKPIAKACKANLQRFIEACALQGLVTK